jgi:hypothetical protein
MQSIEASARPLRISDEGSGRVALEAPGEAGETWIFLGYEGPPLPARLEAARLEPLAPGAWRLSGAQGQFDFHARGLELLEPKPDLFAELLAPFALGQRDRWLVGILLKLLRLPGGAWLLRRWHSRRR